jgi:hypothetical protein
MVRLVRYQLEGQVFRLLARDPEPAVLQNPYGCDVVTGNVSIEGPPRFETQRDSASVRVATPLPQYFLPIQ